MRKRARRILRPDKKTTTLIRDPELRRQKREEVANAAFDQLVAVSHFRRYKP
jgi:hypothetical protein